MAFNYHISRVLANLNQREAERSYDIGEENLTPSLPWNRFAFINNFNAWKNGQLSTSPVNQDGSVGLAWRAQVSADAFEVGSVQAAQALANFLASRSGARAGRKMRFPRLKARRKSRTSFTIRNRAQPGVTQQIRILSPKSIRVPTLGELRVHGSTKRARRMLESGRLHIHSATFSFERGRWWVSLTGVAAQIHPARQARTRRHHETAGMDRGVKTLAVIADASGKLLAEIEGVKPLTAALEKSHDRLRRASRAYARTKPGSEGRRKAKGKLTKIYARIAHQRSHGLHLLSHWCATHLSTLVVEDLNVSDMHQLRNLARALNDAGMGELCRQLEYKAAWYGLNLVVADRWYPSSRTCHQCGAVNRELTLAMRAWTCARCGQTHDRDVNAAINLARWPSQLASAYSPPPAAA